MVHTEKLVTGRYLPSAPVDQISTAPVQALREVGANPIRAGQRRTHYNWRSGQSDFLLIFAPFLMSLCLWVVWAWKNLEDFEERKTYPSQFLFIAGLLVTGLMSLCVVMLSGSETSGVIVDSFFDKKDGAPQKAVHMELAGDTKLVTAHSDDLWELMEAGAPRPAVVVLNQSRSRVWEVKLEERTYDLRWSFDGPVGPIATFTGLGLGFLVLGAGIEIRRWSRRVHSRSPG